MASGIAPACSSWVPGYLCMHTFTQGVAVSKLLHDSYPTFQTGIYMSHRSQAGLRERASVQME